MRKTERIERMIVLIAGVGACYFCTGCVALPLGTVLGFAGSAASAGSEVYSLGKLEFSGMASFDESKIAVNDAIADLHLHVRKSDVVGKEKDELQIFLEDDPKKEIEIRIDRRSDRLCQFRVDVGIFGFEPTAKLIMDRIRLHLPPVISQTCVCLH